MSRSEPRPRAVVVVDTREQQPYEFDPARIEVVRRALVAGDYALDGFETGVVIERKSLDDYVTSVILARDRFLRELERLSRDTLPYIVVEASLDDIAEHRYRAGVHPNAVFGATWAIMADYHVPVLFCGDRQRACQFVEGLLLRTHHTAVAASEEAEANQVDHAAEGLDA